MTSESIRTIIRNARQLWTPKTGVIVYMSGPDTPEDAPYRLCLYSASRKSSLVPDDVALWRGLNLVIECNISDIPEWLEGLDVCLVRFSTIYKSSTSCFKPGTDKVICLESGCNCKEERCPCRR